MAAGRSRARSRVACTFGMGVVALVGVAMIPARAAAQQKQTTPSQAGTVMPGISDDQICSMLKGALKGKKGGNSAANRRTYQQIDVATPERALQGHILASRSAMRSAAEGSAVTPEFALLGRAPATGAATKNAAPQGGGMQISVSTGPGQPTRQVTCK